MHSSFSSDASGPVKTIVSIVESHHERENFSTESARRKIEAIFSSGIYYSNLKVAPDTAVRVNGNEIAKIQMLAPNTSETSAMYLYVRYKNNVEELVTINSKDEMNMLQKAFLQLGVTSEYIFARAGVENLDWMDSTKDAIYSNNDAALKERGPTATYNVLHKMILAQLSTLIMDAQRQQNTCLNIIDAGCGDGILLRKIRDNIAEQKSKEFADLDCKLLGFDFNPKNIEKCKKMPADDCHFHTENILNFEHFIQELKSSKQVHSSPDSKTILILSGILTRLVLEDVYQGLDALKSIARSGSVDYLIGGGQGEPMINSYLAKQLGYKQGQEKSGSRPVTNYFYFTKMSEQEFYQYKLDKLQKKNVLDLSFFCLDTKIIERLAKDIKHNTVIDLSYCDYTPGMEKILKEIVKQHPHVKLIFQHNNKKSVIDFAESFIGNALVSRLTHDCSKLRYAQGKNELPLLGIMRRSPRLQALTNQVSNSQNVSSEYMIGTSADTAPTMTECLKAFTGDRQIENLNVDLKILTSYLSKAIPQIRIINRNENPLVEIFRGIKKELIESHPELLQEIFGADYAKSFSKMNLSTDYSLDIYISGKDKYTNELGSLVVNKFREAADAIMENVTTKENYNDLLPLLVILSKGIRIRDYDHCEIAKLNADFGKQMNLYRSLANKIADNHEPEFLREFSRQLASGMNASPKGTSPLTDSGGDDSMQIYSEIWEPELGKNNKL